MIVVLAGGVGAARFLEGLVQVVEPESIAAIVNTGDDIVLHGLAISPDVDIVTCTLAGIIDQQQGWGIAGDSYEALGMLARLGADDWFKLGDRDLALHIRRSARLREGLTPTQVADEIRRALGVRVQILPMSDEVVTTRIVTPEGPLHFQEYLVRRRAQDEVLGTVFEGVEAARPTPAVLGAIAEAEAVLIAPSNPIVSVGTILALPGLRAALEATSAPVVAVSPIVGGRPIKGPAVPLMRAAGLEISPLGVADAYAGLLDALVIDEVDAALAPTLAARGLRVVVTDTIMRGPPEKAALAWAALQAARAL
jgi:LPPG:FO 2-phospho-L-lactate transferase